jgi:hypothetical protein
MVVISHLTVTSIIYHKMMDTAIMNKLHELCEFTTVDNPFVWDLFESILLDFHIKDIVVGTMLSLLKIIAFLQS